MNKLTWSLWLFFLHKHLNILNIICTVSCFYYLACIQIQIYPHWHCSLQYITSHIIYWGNKFHHVPHLDQNRTCPCRTLGYVLLGKRPYSSIQNAPGQKKKQPSKYKRQTFINIVIWKYVKQVLFLHKEKKARFLAIKTGQVVLVNPALLNYLVLLCTS